MHLTCSRESINEKYIEESENLELVVNGAAGLYRRRLRFGFFFEKSFLKYQDGDDPNGNGCIGDIKNRTEKFKIIAADKGKPFREMGPDQREIQHVDNPTMKKTGISMRREDFGYMVEGTFFKNQSIKQAVNQIAQGSGKDERRANDESPVIFSSDDVTDIENSEYYCCHPEQGESHFSKSTSEFPSPGHAFIFHEIDLKFITQDFDAIVVRRYYGMIIGIPGMAKRHMCFDPYLQALVGQDHQKNNQKNMSDLHLSKEFRAQIYSISWQMMG